MSLESVVKFSLEFLLQLNASEQSKVYSSISLLHSLSLIYVGANKNTAKQIADIIGKDKNREEIVEYYSNFVQRYKQSNINITTKSDLKSRKRKLQPNNDDNINDDTVNVIMANKLFVSKDTPLLPKYQEILKNKFNAEFKELNFEDSETSATEINSFVNEATNGMIKDIISAEEINSEMVAAIINAIYFQGFWEKPFKNRQKQKFYSTPVRSIDMMTTSPKDGDWNFREGKNWSSLGIPYKNRKAWMFIVLPEKRDGLADLMKKMNFEFFKDVTTRQNSQRLGVTIPIIETVTEFELPEYLSKLGISDAFNEKCDLTNMFKGKHKIGKAIHKAVIKVDEKGTEASAATALFPQPQSSPGFFAADHPFLYFILTTGSSTSITPQDILFIGTFC